MSDLNPFRRIQDFLRELYGLSSDYSPSQNQILDAIYSAAEEMDSLLKEQANCIEIMEKSMMKELRIAQFERDEAKALVEHLQQELNDPFRQLIRRAKDMEDRS